MPRMRHLGTALAALVIAPSAWLLLAFGQERSLQVFARRDETGASVSGGVLQPLLLLAGAGLLLGLIATLRFSPLGTVLTGLLYLGSYALLLVWPDAILHLFTIKVTIAGAHADAATPLRTGTSALVGAMMLIAVFSVGRWRRWPDREDSSWDRSYDDRTAYDRDPINLTSWTSSLRR
jgi:hypothetical protein